MRAQPGVQSSMSRIDKYCSSPERPAMLPIGLNKFKVGMLAVPQLPKVCLECGGQDEGFKKCATHASTTGGH